MRPVRQTQFGAAGNCWQAAVASLLDLALQEVPDFVHERWPAEKNEGEGRWEWEDGVRLNPFWFQDFRLWLESRGLQAAWIGRPAVRFVRVSDGCCHLRNGRSPRGRDHTVVALGDAVVHDPHPDGTGLLEVDELTFVFPKEKAMA